MRSNIEAWIADAPDQSQKEMREAVHTILSAIAELRSSGIEVVMKGGILVAVGYEGDRMTKDVDFSTSLTLAQMPAQQFLDRFDAALANAADESPYGLTYRIQSHEVRPPGEEKSFPTLKIKVGYAKLTDERKLKRLKATGVSTPVAVDLSYNEVITGSELFEVSEGTEILASTLVDLVAEKYRAMLQQVIRDRKRRQDVYDLYWLLRSRHEELHAERQHIKDALIQKTIGRGIDATALSLRNAEIEQRSKVEYPQIADEILGPLPPFEIAFGAVREFYESMPW